MSRIVLALAFFFGTAAAGSKYNPSISLKVTDTKLTNGLGSLNLGGEFETKLNDDLSVGAEYDYNECENAPKQVFARWSKNDGDSKLGVLARLNLKGKSADADVTSSRGATDLEVNLDSARSTVVNEVSLSHKLNAGGRGLTLNPKWEADGNKATLRTRLNLNDDTHVELEGDVSADRNAVLRVAHQVDASNRVTPELNLKSGHMTYEWERALGDGNTLTANINPNDKVELEWTDSGARGAWTTKVNVPWANAKDADVSFQRKFNL